MQPVIKFAIGRKATAKKTVYNAAAGAWNRASEKTGRVGKKILKLKATTPEGLLIRARVIETHDEILKVEPAELLLVEIKQFAKVLRAA
jgi:selenophosphate synthase